MDFVVTHRGYLEVGTVLLCLVFLVWRVSPVIMSRRARRYMWVFRALVVLLICLGLADIKLLFKSSQDGGNKIVFLVDVSESVDPSERERAYASIVSLIGGACESTGTETAVVLFNGETSVLVPSDGVLSVDQCLEAERELRDHRGATNLASGLNRVLCNMSGACTLRLVLFSDGRPTGGDIDGIIENYRLRGVKIDTVVLKARKPDGLMVESFNVPEKVFILEKFPVEALVRSAGDGQVRVRLFRDGSQLANEILTVKAGTTRWKYQAREESVGRHRYSFHVEGLSVADTYEQNNFQVAALQADTVPRILVVTDSEKEVLPFSNALKAARIKNKVVLEGDFPHGISGLLQYSAVIFVNVSADRLRQRQQLLLKRYVKDFGGGFMMAGGSKSFGLGAYYDTPVEEILPVFMSPQSYSTSFGLILLLDSSSSMNGFPIQWTKRAAKQIIWLMRGKYLGIYYFNNNPAVAVALQRIDRNRVIIEQDIDSITARGGTSFAPALQLALQELRVQPFSNKHIILLSDGNPSDFPAVRRLYGPLLAAGVKVSTIGIGTRVNNTVLREIAANTDGRFYLSQEVHRIPEIFEEEVKRIVGPPYVEERFIPETDTGSRLAKGFSFPRLLGYIGTTPKQRARVDLRSPHGDAILAHWRFGLGQTVAFTSDVGTRWARYWLDWKDAPRFWGRVVKHIIRTHLSDFELNIVVRNKVALFTVDGIDARGEYINGATLTVSLEDPDGVNIGPIVLAQVGAGRYEGMCPLGKKGFYDVTVYHRPRDKPAKIVADGIAAQGFSPEYRFSRADKAFLAGLSALTGGKLRSDIKSLGSELIDKAERVDVSDAWSTWPFFLLAALVLFAVEITVRRLNLLGTDREEGAHGARGSEVTSYKRIADQYLQLAKELDRKGNERQAQEYYLKARSFYLKAKHTDQAARMWERYRFLDQKRAG